MKIFDSHAHIGLVHSDPIEQLIVANEAKQAGVVAIMNICNNADDFFSLYDNLKMADNVYYAIGAAPSEVNNNISNLDATIERGLKLPNVLAIGEIGLDYYRKFGSRDSQIDLFVRQLDLAARIDKPVIIHNRQASDDIFQIVTNRLPERGGVLHCYSEDWAFAKKMLQFPLYLSFSGNITYRNTRDLHEAVRNAPLDRILVESESPFIVPSCYRGRRNRPIYITEVIKSIAEIRGMPVEELADALYANSVKFWGVDPIAD